MTQLDGRWGLRRLDAIPGGTMADRERRVRVPTGAQRAGAGGSGDESARVLLVDDDRPWRSSLAGALRASGLVVATCDHWGDVLEEVAAFGPTVVVMDQGGPGGPSLGLCRELRQRGVSVVIVSAHRYDGDAIAGYEAGADAHVRKPVGLHELVARVRAIVRRLPTARTAGHLPGVVQAGPVVLDRASRSVRVGSVPVVLSRSEFDLLDVLVSNAGDAVRREEMMRLIHLPRTAGTGLDAHVRRLRAKLELVDPTRRISVVRGVGFRFLVDVAEASGPVAGEPRPEDDR
ncbi:MAG: afsQ1 [Acidimicrobiales bacterium]|nr:afsQ1 [Acidimicrobiales bacterium]